MALAHIPSDGARLVAARQAKQPGRDTLESTWLLDPRWDGVPRLDLDTIVDRCRRTVVIAVHRDDAHLALGATIADLAGKGHSVTVVSATHGGIYLTENELCEALTGLVDTHTLLLPPDEGDGHANYREVARVAGAQARQSGALFLTYPLRLWDRAAPSDIDWTRLRTLTPSLAGLHAKAEAVSPYSGQLGQAALDRARRVVECVLLPRATDLAEHVEGFVIGPRSRATVAAPFDDMYEQGKPDPWHFDDSVYERRRLDLVLACLGRTRYDRTLEIGCATGQLCVELSRRADEVVGLDASARALEVARAKSDEVHWVLGAAPGDLPSGDFNLIVLSEIAYFLDGADLLATLRGARRRLRQHGEIVIANWLRPTANIPFDGPTVHRQASAVLELPLRARYEDADLLIEVWGEPRSVYDAYGGGS